MVTDGEVYSQHHRKVVEVHEVDHAAPAFERGVLSTAQLDLFGYFTLR